MNITYFLKIRGQQKARLSECFINCPSIIFHDLCFSNWEWISTFYSVGIKCIYSQSSIPSLYGNVSPRRKAGADIRNWKIVINGRILCNRSYIECISCDQKLFFPRGSSEPKILLTAFFTKNNTLRSIQGMFLICFSVRSDKRRQKNMPWITQSIVLSEKAVKRIFGSEDPLGKQFWIAGKYIQCNCGCKGSAH